MTLDECYFIGFVSGKFSFKGEVTVKIDSDQPDELLNMESVFVLYGTNLVPFFIEFIRKHKGTLIRIKFEDIDTEADAEDLIGAQLYRPLSELPDLEGDQFYFHEVKGFQLIDESFGRVGEISGVQENASQELFLVDHNGKQVLVPIIDDFIRKVDKDAREIHVSVPEGLIEMYLS